MDRARAHARKSRLNNGDKKRALLADWRSRNAESVRAWDRKNYQSRRERILFRLSVKRLKAAGVNRDNPKAVIKASYMCWRSYLLTGRRTDPEALLVAME